MLVTVLSLLDRFTESFWCRLTNDAPHPQSGLHGLQRPHSVRMWSIISSIISTTALCMWSMNVLLLPLDLARRHEFGPACASHRSGVCLMNQ